MPRDGLWERLRSTEVILTFLGNLFLPRLSHRLRWHTRLGPTGTLIYVAAWAAFVMSFFWFANKMARRQEEMRSEVRAKLGREPTTDEVFEDFHGERQS